MKPQCDTFGAQLGTLGKIQRELIDEPMRYSQSEGPILRWVRIRLDSTIDQQTMCCIT